MSLQTDAGCVLKLRFQYCIGINIQLLVLTAKLALQFIFYFFNKLLSFSFELYAMVLTTSSTGAFQLIFGKTSNVAKTLRKPELRHKLKSTHRKGKWPGLFLYLLPLCGKDFRNIVLSHQGSSFVWLLCLELAWRAGPLRIREVIVTFLTLANPAL